MRRTRLNFELISEPDASQCTSLKPGTPLQIDRSATDVVRVATEDGVSLGVLPEGALEHYHPSVAFEGSIRSLKRTQEGSIGHIYVCVSPCKKKRNEQILPRWERETIDEEWFLKDQHYEALAASERIRIMLKNEELQLALKTIDTAEDRETALHSAHQSSEIVKTFFETVLDTIHLTENS